MTLTDVYCRINRARGMEVSNVPDSFAFLCFDKHYFLLISLVYLLSHVYYVAWLKISFTEY